MQERWKPLDLRKRAAYGPNDDELIVLRLTPCNPNDRHIRHYVGRFKTEDRKAWFFSDNIGTLNIAKYRRSYDIHWCRLPAE